MKKFLFLVLAVLCFSSILNAAVLSVAEYKTHGVVVESEGFSTTSYAKIIYVDGVEFSRFNFRSAAGQSKELTLEVGVHSIFYQERDMTSNTLTVKVIGIWDDGDSKVYCETSGFELVQSISITAAAPSYIYVTCFAQDMLIIENLVSSSKATIFELTESETAAGPGNTETIRAVPLNVSASLQPEGGAMILPAGEFLRVRLIEGTTGVRYLTLHYLLLSNWNAIERSRRGGY